MKAFLSLMFLFFSVSLYAGDFKIYKNISYQDSSSGKESMLDIYVPKDRSSLKEVMIFIHGGSWVSGKKNTYAFVGKRLASKGKIAVIINYPLAHGSGISQLE